MIDPNLDLFFADHAPVTHITLEFLLAPSLMSPALPLLYAMLVLQVNLQVQSANKTHHQHNYLNAWATPTIIYTTTCSACCSSHARIPDTDYQTDEAYRPVTYESHIHGYSFAMVLSSTSDYVFANLRDNITQMNFNWMK